MNRYRSIELEYMGEIPEEYDFLFKEVPEEGEEIPEEGEEVIAEEGAVGVAEDKTEAKVKKEKKAEEVASK